MDVDYISQLSRKLQELFPQEKGKLKDGPHATGKSPNFMAWVKIIPMSTEKIWSEGTGFRSKREAEHNASKQALQWLDSAPKSAFAKPFETMTGNASNNNIHSAKGSASSTIQQRLSTGSIQAVLQVTCSDDSTNDTALQPRPGAGVAIAGSSIGEWCDMFMPNVYREQVKLMCELVPRLSDLAHGERSPVHSWLLIQDVGLNISDWKDHLQEDVITGSSGMRLFPAYKETLKDLLRFVRNARHWGENAEDDDTLDDLVAYMNKCVDQSRQPKMDINSLKRVVGSPQAILILSLVKKYPKLLLLLEKIMQDGNQMNERKLVEYVRDEAACPLSLRDLLRLATFVSDLEAVTLLLKHGVPIDDEVYEKSRKSMQVGNKDNAKMIIGLLITTSYERDQNYRQG